MDVILMLFFCYKNYKLAVRKKVPPFKWAVITALIWIIFEVTGAALYASIAEIDLINIEQWENNPFRIFAVVIFGIACGYLGYLLVRRSILAKTSDESGEEY